MSVTMDSTWERASGVIAGRAGILASIAAATLWLPVVVEQGVVGVVTGGDPVAGTARGIVGLLTVPVALVGYWGRLAIVAVASDAAVTAGDACRAAARRLPLLIGLLAIAVLVLAVLALPVGIALAPVAARMPSYTAANLSASLSGLSAGRAAFASLYALAVAIALAWVAVRLIATGPVVLLERQGVASFRRSFQVTRGHFWRLFGAALPYLVVLFVAANATVSVTGVAARLIAGPDHPATVAFVTTSFAAAVAAAAAVVAETFVTRFYLLRVAPPVSPPIGQPIGEN